MNASIRSVVSPQGLIHVVQKLLAALVVLSNLWCTNVGVSQAQRTPVYSQDYGIYTNEYVAGSEGGEGYTQPYAYFFRIGMFGGSGFGDWEMVWVNITNWQPAGTPFYPPFAGAFTFYIRKLGDSEYAESNYAGPYTLTVSKRYQDFINDSNANLYRQVTISSGSYTPNFVGGSGTGAWQAVYENYTNWGDSNTFTPPGPGTYTYWIRRLDDNNYYMTDPCGPFTLTVQ